MRSLTRLCALSLAAVCLALAAAHARAQKPQSDGERKAGAARLYPVMVKFKWGYIDRSGKLVIQPQFTAAGSFSEGLAYASTSDCVFAATRADDTPCGYGYIDKTGKFVVEQRYDYAESFRDGVAHVIEGGARGYIDHEGKFIWKPSK